MTAPEVAEEALAHIGTPRDYLSIFLRGFGVVFLVAANTKQIAGHHLAGAGVFGTLISLFWFANARTAGTTRVRWAREAYSCGAGVGTIAGMLTMEWFYGR